MLGEGLNALIGSPGTILLAFGAVLGRAVAMELAQDPAPGTAERPGCPCPGSPVRAEAAGTESSSLLRYRSVGAWAPSRVARPRARRACPRGARVERSATSPGSGRCSISAGVVGLAPAESTTTTSASEGPGRARSTTVRAVDRRQVALGKRSHARTPARPGSVAAAAAPRPGVGGPASHGMIRGTEPRASLARGPTPGGRHTGRCVTLGVRGFGACGIDPEARGSASPGRRRRTGAAVREWGPVSSAMHSSAA